LQPTSIIDAGYLMNVPTRLAVAVLLAAALAGCGRDGHGKTATPSASVTPSASPLSSPRAAELASQLTAGDEAALRSALAIPSGQAIDPAAVQQFAALGQITFDLSTFQYLDPITATVAGHVAHPPPGTSTEWTFTLVYVAPDWKLADGYPSR
jgi:hypothetical protein